MEIWRKIEGCENYSVSTYGRVRNDKTGNYVNQGRSNGYLVVHIEGIHYPVHRLVAKTFIPNPENLSDVNHIDEDKQNNNVENLEWLSHIDNVRYSIGVKILVDNVEFPSMRAAAKHINCSVVAISRAIKRGTFKVEGHTISYA